MGSSRAYAERLTLVLLLVGGATFSRTDFDISGIASATDNADGDSGGPPGVDGGDGTNMPLMMSSPPVEVPACPLISGLVELDGRELELYVPSSAKPKAPLVLVWHGIASKPSEIEAKMQFKAKAEETGMILAYPVGTGIPKAFNGAGCCSQASLGKAKDDMGFAKAIIDHLSEACIDPYKVFSVGFSNGGFMTHRLACEAGLRTDGRPWIKAVAVHSGLMADNYQCPFAQGPIPILMFHGTADKVVGINGDNSLAPKLMRFKSLDAVTASYVTANGCLGADFLATQASATATCTSYSDCGVERCDITGLPHSWSGEPSLLATRTDDIDATGRIVQFFQKYME